MPTRGSAHTPPPVSDDELAPFYYAWRPATRFKLTMPPPPEFRIVVLETDKRPMLNVDDFDVLFSHVPLEETDDDRLQEIREQNRRAYGKHRTPRAPRAPRNSKKAHATALATLLARFVWLLAALGSALRRLLELAGVCEPSSMPRMPTNVYLPLKTGRRSVVVAIVDQGTTSLLRFGEAEFTRWRLAGRAL